MPTNAILRIELLGIEPLIWRRVRIPLAWRLDRVGDVKRLRRNLSERLDPHRPPVWKFGNE